jgi:hypothetical protein
LGSACSGWACLEERQKLVLNAQHTRLLLHADVHSNGEEGQLDASSRASRQRILVVCGSAISCTAFVLFTRFY